MTTNDDTPALKPDRIITKEEAETMRRMRFFEAYGRFPCILTPVIKKPEEKYPDVIESSPPPADEET